MEFLKGQDVYTHTHTHSKALHEPKKTADVTDRHMNLISTEPGGAFRTPFQPELCTFPNSHSEVLTPTPQDVTAFAYRALLFLLNVNLFFRGGVMKREEDADERKDVPSAGSLHNCPQQPGPRQDKARSPKLHNSFPLK